MNMRAETFLKIIFPIILLVALGLEFSHLSNIYSSLILFVITIICVIIKHKMGFAKPIEKLTFYILLALIGLILIVGLLFYFQVIPQ
jgi:hypothetical protein